MDESSLRVLLDAWEELGARERRAVVLFASRLLQGQQTHGWLTYAKKNWAKETVEEGVDAAAYLTFLALDLEDDGKA